MSDNINIIIEQQQENINIVVEGGATAKTVTFSNAFSVEVVHNWFTFPVIQVYDNVGAEIADADYTVESNSGVSAEVTTTTITFTEAKSGTIVLTYGSSDHFANLASGYATEAKGYRDEAEVFAGDANDYSVSSGNSAQTSAYGAQTATEQAGIAITAKNDAVTAKNLAEQAVIDCQDIIDSIGGSLSDYVTLATQQTITGQKKFDEAIIVKNEKGVDVELTEAIASLNIGTSNADIINIGWSGATINFQGTLINQNVTNIETKDKLIRLNVGGSVASGVSSGFEIEENSVITGWFTTNGNRDGWEFKAPANAFTANLYQGNLTANRIYTLPNKAGTFAMTDDVPTGMVTGPDSAVGGNFASFNLTTGKIIKDSGYSASSFYGSDNPSSFISRSGISGTSPIGYDSSTGVISIQVASASQNGYLSSSDWSTFNGKQATGLSWLLGGNTIGAKKLLGSIDNYDIGIITNNTERVTILKTGEVGIGVSPSYKLDINGDIHTSSGYNMLFGCVLPSRQTGSSTYPGIFVGESNSSVMGETTSGYKGLNLNANIVRSSTLYWVLQDITQPGWNLAMNYETSQTDYFSINRSPQGTSGTVNFTSLFFIKGSTSNIGLNGITSPTARLHIKAGTASAGTAPLKLNSGVLNTIAEAGAIENNGTNLFYTNDSAVRKTLAFQEDSWLLGGNTIGAKKLLGSVDNYDVGIITNNTERITVLKTGEVGIGITPTKQLTIGGTTLLTMTAADGLSAYFRAENKSNNGVANAGFAAINNSGYVGELFKNSTTYSSYKILSSNDLGFYNDTNAGNICILNDYASGKILLSAGSLSFSGLTIDSKNNVFVNSTTGTSLFQVTQPTTGVGTVSNSAGGTTVTGVGTQFTNTFKVGDTITIGGQTVAISAIASDTSMTTAAITSAHSGSAYTLVGGDRFFVKGNGITSLSQLSFIALNTAPASNATGTAGETRFCADAIYICVATNTWMKATLASY